MNDLRLRKRCRSAPASRSGLIVFAIVSILLALVVSPRHGKTANQAATPTLLTQNNSTRAIALESVTLLSEPFAPTTIVPFNTDSRTRVMLFATDLGLLPGEGAAAVTAEAEDASRTRYPLTVEYAGVVAGFEWMTAVIVRLNNNLGDVGDVLVGVTVHGLPSNRVRIGIGPIGGGPPDDQPGPGPVPDLQAQA